MCEISIADGFVEINANLGEMIKYVANEPSVGLYYMQQHAQNAVPNVVRLTNDLTEKSSEVRFHTEDLEDSIAMTRTMKECGFPIIDEMIQDIKTSLTLMSSKQPKQGVILQRSSSNLIVGSSSWGSPPWARSTSNIQDESEKPGSYFSNVFKSAKEAVNLTWPQLDNRATEQPDEPDVMPLSSQVENERIEEFNESTGGKTQLLLPSGREFDEFKAEKEALLEDWLISSVSVT